MIDFSGTKIINNTLQVNVKVEDNEYYENIYLKNIKIYNQDTYTTSNQLWPNAASKDTTVYGTLKVKSNVDYGIEILLPEVREQANFYLKNLPYDTEFTIPQLFGWEDPENINDNSNVYLEQECNSDKKLVPDRYGAHDGQLPDFIKNIKNTKIRLVRKIFELSYWDKTEDIRKPIKITGYVFENESGEYMCYPKDGNFYFISEDEMVSQPIIITDTKQNTIFLDNGTNNSHILYFFDESSSLLELTKHNVQGIKSNSITLTEQDLFDPINNIPVPIDSNSFFIVEVEVQGTPAENTPCKYDKSKESIVIYNKQLPFKQALGYLHDMDDCTPSKSFIDFILRLKGLELAVAGCNYQQAAKYWKWFVGNVTDPCSKVKRKSNCGCHG